MNYGQFLTGAALQAWRFAANGGANGPCSEVGHPDGGRGTDRRGFGIADGDWGLGFRLRLEANPQPQIPSPKLPKPVFVEEIPELARGDAEQPRGAIVTPTGLGQRLRDVFAFLRVEVLAAGPARFGGNAMPSSSWI